MENAAQERYYCNLGRLVGKLRALEFWLRGFLFKVEHEVGTPCAPLDQAGVGEWVPENAMTDYRDLKQLIRSYNCRIKVWADSGELSIDQSAMVDVRDAIAHGRVFARQPTGPFHLMKYSNPKDTPECKEGNVQVTFHDVMLQGWFNEQIKLVHDAIQKVHQADERLT